MKQAAGGNPHNMDFHLINARGRIIASISRPSFVSYNHTLIFYVNKASWGKKYQFHQRNEWRINFMKLDVFT